MTKFQYYIWPVDNDQVLNANEPGEALLHVKDGLQQCGQKGWELVLTVDILGKPHFVYKRPTS